MILACDIGSTSCKVDVYEVNSALAHVAGSSADYPLNELPGGGVEQNPEDWWQAVSQAAKTALRIAGAAPETIEGIAFCAQMQGLVLVDRNLEVLRPAMSYMDQRAVVQHREGLARGIRIQGMNLRVLSTGMRINGALAASVKDPVWKYRWVSDEEPEIFARIHKWLDVKDYLVARATGECTMTEDSAFPTFLTDQRQVHPKWSPRLLRLYGVDPRHLPRIIRSWDHAGPLRPEAARDLGLMPGTPVFGGGGDASMISLGSGAMTPGDTYAYTGTSGWVATAVTRMTVDVSRRIASIVGAQAGTYHYFGEQETAGKCLEWVRDHLALDEIHLYLSRENVASDPESRFRSLYDFLIHTIADVPAGAGGVLFAPWLHGNRAPFEDDAARGIFFNIGLNTGKRKLLRAVVEGIIYHQKWLLESIRRKFPTSNPIRFTGGGALSPAVAQIMADIFETPVETLANPQNTGTAGAALTAARGLGIIEDYSRAKELVQTAEVFHPNRENFDVYRKQYSVFKKLYRTNRRLFRELNS